MIDKLKFLIDGCENSPNNKALLLTIAKLPEHKQEDALRLIEYMLDSWGLKNES